MNILSFIFYSNMIFQNAFFVANEWLTSTPKQILVFSLFSGTINVLGLFNSETIFIVKLATIVKGDPKARFLIATTPRFGRCPWCNGYCRRMWTQRHEFKSWTWLIAFHIVLIPLGKVWIQLFSLQLWVNSRAD